MGGALPRAAGDGAGGGGRRLRLGVARRSLPVRPGRRLAWPVGGVDVARCHRRCDEHDRARSAGGVNELPSTARAGQAGSDGRRHLVGPAHPRPRCGMEPARIRPRSACPSTTASAASPRRSRSSARCSATARSISTATTTTPIGAFSTRGRPVPAVRRCSSARSLNGCSTSRCPTSTVGTSGSACTATPRNGFAREKARTSTSASPRSDESVRSMRRARSSSSCRVGRDARWAITRPIPCSHCAGTPTSSADQLRELESVGAAHVQLVVDPITRDSIDWLAAMLDACRR